MELLNLRYCIVEEIKLDPIGSSNCSTLTKPHKIAKVFEEPKPDDLKLKHFYSNSIHGRHPFVIEGISFQSLDKKPNSAIIDALILVS